MCTQMTVGQYVVNISDPALYGRVLNIRPGRIEVRTNPLSLRGRWFHTCNFELDKEMNNRNFLEEDL